MSVMDEKLFKHRIITKEMCMVYILSALYIAFWDDSDIMKNKKKYRTRDVQLYLIDGFSLVS